MVRKKKGALCVGITGILIILLLLLAAAGCGSKKEAGEKGAPEDAQTSEKTGSEQQEAQGQNIVFSTTVSADTKTDTFQVKTSSQTLYYNLIGGDKATVTITIYSHPDGKMQAGANAFEPGPHQKTIYLAPGTYYMEILPDDCTVEVKVED
ncbi:hypothetical protein [Candidatus Solincola tengchongensis]|uniref:hypothetical protein n=1 Tax=Candidatus Solincola tengchongensis TaxID=2900693 RepID=UPI00257A8C87|nr:hypothetical protein [Candidatus Solincola tengchongensis]